MISFDDDVFASWIRPQLTTVALPHYELGRTAVELLLDQVSGSAPRRQRIHRVPMPLRERSSVRDLAHPGPQKLTRVTGVIPQRWPSAGLGGRQDGQALGVPDKSMQPGSPF